MAGAFAALALVAALSGSARALCAMPAWCVAATGVLAAAGALRTAQRRAQLVAALVAGSLAALTLPRMPPPVAGDVISRAPKTNATGDLFALLDRLDSAPDGMLGTRETVGGEWTPAAAGNAATVSRRIMACCAADAVAVGFDVVPAARAAIAAGAEVRVSGTLRSSMRDGELRYALVDASVCPLASGAPSKRSGRPRHDRRPTPSATSRGSRPCRPR